MPAELGTRPGRGELLAAAEPSSAHRQGQSCPGKSVTLLCAACTAKDSRAGTPHTGAVTSTSCSVAPAQSWGREANPTAIPMRKAKPGSSVQMGRRGERHPAHGEQQVLKALAPHGPRRSQEQPMSMGGSSAAKGSGQVAAPQGPAWAVCQHSLPGQGTRCQCRCHAGAMRVPAGAAHSSGHPLRFLFFRTCRPARVAISNTSRTPSLVLAEHSR